MVNSFTEMSVCGSSQKPSVSMQYSMRSCPADRSVSVAYAIACEVSGPLDLREAVSDLSKVIL